MRTLLITACLIILGLSQPRPVSGQGDQVEAIRRQLSGSRELITFRDGGPLYGRFYFLRVDFCPNGTYFTRAESHRTTALNNQENSSWVDRGAWTISVFEGQSVLRYLSKLNGKTDAVPITLLPTGQLWIREGVSIVPQGRAACF